MLQNAQIKLNLPLQDNKSTKNKNMITIVAKFKVEKENDSSFLTIIKELITESNAEEGCIEYLLHKDVNDALSYCLVEKWKDQAAVDFHNSTPHFTSAVPKLKELAEITIDVYKTV